MIPRSRLSSDESSPSSKIGSFIDTVVELTVVVVPVTVRLPPIATFRVTSKSLETVKSLPTVTSFGNPTVSVEPLALVSISLEVPAIVNECDDGVIVPESPANVLTTVSASDTAPDDTVKSLVKDATPFTEAVASAIVKSCVFPSPVLILTLLFALVYSTSVRL